MILKDGTLDDLDVCNIHVGVVFLEKDIEERKETITHGDKKIMVVKANLVVLDYGFVEDAEKKTVENDIT